MIETYTYKGTDKRLSTHFCAAEFKCPASNTIKYSTDLISMLEKIFTNCSNVGKCIITSGYRTPEHSVKVGGSRDDAHVMGIAADCIFYDKKGRVIPPMYLACHAADLGFGGIGIISNNAIHLDVRHLGGYKNKLWHGDERTNYSLSANGRTFYQYFGLTKEAVRTTLGIKSTSPAPAPEKIVRAGDTVRIRSGAKDMNSKKPLAAWAYLRDYTVKSMNGSRCVLTYHGTVVTAIDKADLMRV